MEAFDMYSPEAKKPINLKAKTPVSKNIPTKQTLHQIGGLNVSFPFQPYSCQIDFMTSTIQALQSGSNALLESPTGTGKTLSLLCSTLAWQQSQKLAIPQTEFFATPAGQQHGNENGNPLFPSHSQVPTIFYTSRTHSQLSQVVKEVRASAYHPSMTILGSRQQLCIHDRVSTLSGTAINHACSALTQTRPSQCRFRNNVPDVSFGGSDNPASSLVNPGHAVMKPNTALTNHMTESIKTNSETTDSTQKKHKGIGGRTVTNSTIGTTPITGNGAVMDIEDLVNHGKQQSMCPYFFSRHNIATSDLIVMPYNYLLDPSTRDSLKVNWSNSVVVFDEAHNIEGIASDAASSDLTSTDLAGSLGEIDQCIAKAQEVGYGSDTPNAPPDLGSLLIMKQLLLNLETDLDAIQLPSGGGGISRNGVWLLELLSKRDVHAGSVQPLVTELQKAVDLLMNARVLGGPASSLRLEVVIKFFRTVFRAINADDVRKMSDRYRCFVAPQPVITSQKKKSGVLGGSVTKLKQSHSSTPVGKVLSYWCFCPGIAMEELKALGVRSILLASGTLAPLNSFAAELRLEFPIRLENPHVIGQNQVWAGVLSNGVLGNSLNSSFNHRESSSYKKDLESAVNYWKESHSTSNGNRDIFSILQNVKSVFIEPRNTSELKDVIIFFEKEIDRTNGAILLAVCRGKVSEGLDFADSKARAVIVTGIPFAPSQDPKVMLKKEQLNVDASAFQRLHGKHKHGDGVLTGEEWYIQQAVRAVNQAVGRVIRHKDDWGAIIFMDERFASARLQECLSAWLRPFVKNYGKTRLNHSHYNSAGGVSDMMKHLNQFLSLAETNAAHSENIQLGFEVHPSVSLPHTLSSSIGSSSSSTVGGTSNQVESTGYDVDDDLDYIINEEKRQRRMVIVKHQNKPTEMEMEEEEAEDELIALSQPVALVSSGAAKGNFVASTDFTSARPVNGGGWSTMVHPKNKSDVHTGNEELGVMRAEGEEEDCEQDRVRVGEIDYAVWKQDREEKKRIQSLKLKNPFASTVVSNAPPSSSSTSSLSSLQRMHSEGDSKSLFLGLRNKSVSDSDEAAGCGILHYFPASSSDHSSASQSTSQSTLQSKVTGLKRTLSGLRHSPPPPSSLAQTTDNGKDKNKKPKKLSPFGLSKTLNSSSSSSFGENVKETLERRQALGLKCAQKLSSKSEEVSQSIKSSKPPPSSMVKSMNVEQSEQKQKSRNPIPMNLPPPPSSSSSSSSSSLSNSKDFQNSATFTSSALKGQTELKTDPKDGPKTINITASIGVSKFKLFSQKVKQLLKRKQKVQSTYERIMAQHQNKIKKNHHHHQDNDVKVEDDNDDVDYKSFVSIVKDMRSQWKKEVRNKNIENELIASLMCLFLGKTNARSCLLCFVENFVPFKYRCLIQNSIYESFPKRKTTENEVPFLQEYNCELELKKDQSVSSSSGGSGGDEGSNNGVRSSCVKEQFDRRVVVEKESQLVSKLKGSKRAKGLSSSSSSSSFSSTSSLATTSSTKTSKTSSMTLPSSRLVIKTKPPPAIKMSAIVDKNMRAIEDSVYQNVRKMTTLNDEEANVKKGSAQVASMTCSMCHCENISSKEEAARSNSTDNQNMNNAMLMAQCGHIGCKKCWAAWKKSELNVVQCKKLNNPSIVLICPACRVGVPSNSMKRVYRHIVEC